MTLDLLAVLLRLLAVLAGRLYPARTGSGARTTRARTNGDAS